MLTCGLSFLAVPATSSAGRPPNRNDPCSTAGRDTCGTTGTGYYKVYRYDSGWHTSTLGRLYNAEYFVGGYAIHGALSVPAEPASHGCIRIPMYAAEWFPQHVTNGTPVHVLAG